MMHTLKEGGMNKLILAMPIVFWAGWLLRPWMGDWINHHSDGWLVGVAMIVFLQGMAIVLWRTIR